MKTQIMLLFMLVNFTHVFSQNTLQNASIFPFKDGLLLIIVLAVAFLFRYFKIAFSQNN